MLLGRRLGKIEHAAGDVRADIHNPPTARIDAEEDGAVDRVHLLGAAGAVEAIFCLLAMRDEMLPPTINLDNPSVATAIDLVPHKSRKRPINIALSNSFGFGGTNASLVFRHTPQ